jgi:Tol biopolymer transport system component
MGNKINTEGQERFPSVSADGKYLFFARHKDDITYSDFYWVDAKIIADLKPKE